MTRPLGGILLSYLMSAFLGFVQGVTEFLPVSSSGHLALLQTFLGVQGPETMGLLFDVLLHLGTFVSVCIVYRRDIAEMIAEFFRGIAALSSRRRYGGRPPEARRLVFLIIVATLPLLVIVKFKDSVESLGSNTFFIGCALIVTGLLLFFSDRAARGRKTPRNATVGDAVFVGCAQALAVVPGLSRSGTTIAAGLTRGFDRPFAVRFSFLLSLPAILGANILTVKEAVDAGIDVSLLPVYAVGMVVAMLAGLLAIRLVRLLMQKGKFGSFAYYCWFVGIVSIAATLLLERT